MKKPFVLAAAIVCGICCFIISLYVLLAVVVVGSWTVEDLREGKPIIKTDNL